MPIRYDTTARPSDRAYERCPRVQMRTKEIACLPQSRLGMDFNLRICLPNFNDLLLEEDSPRIRNHENIRISLDYWYPSELLGLDAAKSKSTCNSRTHAHTPQKVEL